MTTVAHRNFLNVAQLADRLGISRSTAYKLIWNGELPAVQLGGPGHSLRIDEAELEQWLRGASGRNGQER
jgi:excisionase family DNA binding protein